MFTRTIPNRSHRELKYIWRSVVWACFHIVSAVPAWISFK